MGWGGARVGAGKKPRVRHAEPLTFVPAGQVAATSAAPMAALPGTDLTSPPADMTPEQQDCWRLWAPLAIERNTLIVATVPSFRLLCELHVKKVAIGTMVDRGALGGLRVFMQLAKQVEGLLARFCLAPFGKPAKVEKPKAAGASPWASLGTKL